MVSSTVKDLLQKAGWFAGRDVSTTVVPPPQFPVFQHARSILAEFGGLHIGQSGPGMECATSDVNIDPWLAVHLEPELKQMQSSMNTQLFPLGEVHNGHGYLVIDQEGRTYLLSDELMPLAPDFDRALELLLLGKKPAGKA